MKVFLDKDFLLGSGTAALLYHNYANHMPIIDYHCHLPPDQIANDTNFQNLTQAWLYGDHYKWRAMRTNGIGESYCTGEKTDEEKFMKWAATVPFTVRNPLYHWTHLELQRYFDIHRLLDSTSAKSIYEECSEKLRCPEYSVRNLLRKMNVKVICTTDDPIDSLQHHQTLKEDNFEICVFPTFRPDKAINVDDPATFNHYLFRLESVTNRSISTFSEYLEALKERHDFFATMGCTVSDHGLQQICWSSYTQVEIENIFLKIRSGRLLSEEEKSKFTLIMLHEFAVWDSEKGWVQQYHLGALRNNNSRMNEMSAVDTGWDSVGDFQLGQGLTKFMDRLNKEDQLAKTILYSVNPADNELLASMAGNFNDGSIPGKIQFGSAWWFLDQKDGMTKQLNALSNMGLISRFVGMLTDSRSFLSFPRHEYFRRILCNLFGQEIEDGELPANVEWIGQVIQDICYNNARHYFGWNNNQRCTLPEPSPFTSSITSDKVA